MRLRAVARNMFVFGGIGRGLGWAGGGLPPPDQGTGLLVGGVTALKALRVILGMGGFQLPGVGPAIAQRILQERDQNGPFHYPEDLLTVYGIGTKTLEKIRPQISINK